MAEEAVSTPSRSRKPRPIRIEGGTAYVPLTRGFEAVIDAADVELVGTKNWAAQITYTGHAYACRQRGAAYGGGVELMHRLISQPEDGQFVDHIDGDGLNNRRSNLRNCTHSQNMANTAATRRNKLGLKGAFAIEDGKSFRAIIRVEGRRIHLGCYPTPEEAAAAYRGASKVVYGEFARD